jgi:AbrB family looped-hinge helix DNA binding protein
MPDKLIAVCKISKRGLSLRITLPKEIAEKLNVSESEHIGFYVVNEEIAVRKIEL